VAYAPDSATGGGEDGTVRIWDTRTGQQQLTGHTGRHRRGDREPGNGGRKRRLRAASAVCC